MSSGVDKLRNSRRSRQAPPPDHPRKASGRQPSVVPLSKVAANPHNPRITFTEIEELAQSFRSVGQLQPVTVMTRSAYLELMPDDADAIGDAEFVVVAGGRRLAAAHEAPLSELKISVQDSRDSASLILEAALVENIHRVNLHPLEEAQALADLMKIRELNQKELAARLGRTPAYVSQRLSLLNLVPELAKAFLAGEITVEQARSLARLEQSEQQPAHERPINGVNRGEAPPASPEQPLRPGEGEETPEAGQDAGDGSPINGVNRESGSSGSAVGGAGSQGTPEQPQFQQLTLELMWEPRKPEQLVDRLHEELGEEGFSRVAAIILERVMPAGSVGSDSA